MQIVFSLLQSHHVFMASVVNLDLGSQLCLSRRIEHVRVFWLLFMHSIRRAGAPAVATLSRAMPQGVGRLV